MTTPNQRIDEYGRVVFDENSLLELFYKDQAQSSDILADNIPAIRKYNEWCKTFDALEKQFEIVEPLEISPEEFHTQRQNEWLIPPEYAQLDVESWLFDKAKTDPERRRVSMELSMFKERGMVDALRLFIYVTDTLRKANVWWGVGRGSSVASYCLFLIGVHKVNSLRFDLDIKEFLKDS